MGIGVKSQGLKLNLRILTGKKSLNANLFHLKFKQLACLYNQPRRSNQADHWQILKKINDESLRALASLDAWEMERWFLDL